MKEHPILFTAPMVRAILEGRKTMTRRVTWLEHINEAPDHWYIDEHGLMADRTTGELMGINEEHGMRPYQLMCPYGQPGDQLWVRETWGIGYAGLHDVLYRADPPTFPTRDGHWRPSIFMPRWASRISLELTAVRVERIQDISEDDARAEGAYEEGVPTGRVSGEGDAEECGSYRAGFAALWDSINKARGYGWDANPWVWALTFQRVEP